MQFSFNATTAFLLPIAPPTQSGDQSSFNATTAFLLHAGASWRLDGDSLFQCHHGVPASPQTRLLIAQDPEVSMPPQRSCFPASLRAEGESEEGFNATTAFLLPGSRSEQSMPPGFNATTAFLLQEVAHEALLQFPGFNATTAFLLQPRRRRHDPSTPSFNATTAFLLRVGVTAADGVGVGFQCHHGVPASPCAEPLIGSRERVSMPPRRSCFRAARSGGRGDRGFQCHHGVPASLRGLPGGPGPDGGFNATTAFLLRAGLG